MVEIGSHTTFGWVIHCSDGQNMVSDWYDCVFVNKLKSGRVSAKAYKLTETATSQGAKVWVHIDSVLGIKDAVAFMKAVSQLESSLSVSIDMSSVIQVLSKLDSATAESIRRMHEEGWE